MINGDNVKEREYSFNWLELFIKIIIFAILLILLVWIISSFMGKKCRDITNDYYVVSYFTDSQYQSGVIDNNYQYRYTIKLLDIVPTNFSEVFLVAANYFHSDEEYNNYLKLENNNLSIINQSSDLVSINNLDSFKAASLTAENFTYDISDIYQFEDYYYIDVTLNIGEHSSVSSYSGMYFMPIHLTIRYIDNSNCK